METTCHHTPSVLLVVLEEWSLREGRMLGMERLLRLFMIRGMPTTLNSTKAGNDSNDVSAKSS